MSKKSTVRVVIPTNPEKFLTLAGLVFGKHTTDGAASKLNALVDFNWTDHGAKIAQANTIEAQAKKMARDLDELYKSRDLLLEPLNQTVKASRDLLLGAFANNPKKLGDWGFEVNDSPPKAKKTAP